MEELLNKLIEKGREPFGNYRDIITRYKYDNRFFEFNHEGDNMVSIRELVSIDSGLWQFVCENGMYDYKMGEHKNIVEDFFWNERENCNYYGYLWDKSCWEYYVVESALCNEENLEKFLLDNIKIS